jgi:hypothetical protein
MTNAIITYIGGETDGGARATTWRGVSFPLNEPVEVTDEVLIRKAKGHPHFKVEEHADKEPDADDKAAKAKKGGKKAAGEGDKEPDADDKA